MHDIVEAKQFCTFYIDKHLLGVDASVVQEVILRQHLTPVPLAQSVVLGVINLRGQIVTAIDLRQRLGFEISDQPANYVNVVVRVQEELVSFMVDRIGEVVQIDSNHFESIPDTLQDVARELLIGAYKIPGQLLLVLDPQMVADPSSAE